MNLNVFERLFFLYRKGYLVYQMNDCAGMKIIQVEMFRNDCQCLSKNFHHVRFIELK